MANGDDEDKLLDQLAERLKAIRQDAELVRSGGFAGITGALERAQTGLHDLAASLEALSLRVEQQQAMSARVEAAATKGRADTQALSQTVEALSVRVRQQAEMLDRLSAPRRSRFGAFRVALTIAVLVVGGGMVTLLMSAHRGGFGPLSHLFIGWFSGGTRLTRSADPTGPAQTIASATPDSVSATSRQAPLVPNASAAMNPVALAPTKDDAPTIAAAVDPAPATPPPASAADAEMQNGAQTAIAPLPAQSPAADVAQPPETPAPAPRTPIAISESPPASAEAPSGVPAAIPPAPSKSPALDAAVPSGTAPSTSTMPPVRSIPPAPAATAMAVSTKMPKATPQLVLHATEDAWVRVRGSDGRVVLNRTLRKGETWSVPRDPGFVLDTGNAAGLEVQVDGAPISLAAAKGGVIRNVLLDAGTVGANGERPAR